MLPEKHFALSSMMVSLTSAVRFSYKLSDIFEIKLLPYPSNIFSDKNDQGLYQVVETECNVILRGVSQTVAGFIIICSP